MLCLRSFIHFISLCFQASTATCFTSLSSPSFLTLYQNSTYFSYIQPEEHSGSCLPTGHSGRAWRDVSHLTREGNGFQTGNGRDTPRGDKNRVTRMRKDGAPTRRRSTRHPRREVVSDRLLSARQTERFDTWNV